MKKNIIYVFCICSILLGFFSPVQFTQERDTTQPNISFLTVYAEEENPQIKEQAPPKKSSGAIIGGVIGSAAGPVGGFFGGLIGDKLGGGVAAQIAKLPFTGLMFLLALVAAIITLLSSVIAAIAFEFLYEALRFNTEELVNLLAGDAGNAIKEVWVIFRDLGNIGLVFILVYIAVNFIIQANSSETSKLLGRVIVGALLINFSYFFGAVIIDVSNSLATGIHESIKSETGEDNISDFLVKKTGMEVVEKISSKFLLKQDKGFFENALSGLTFGFDLASSMFIGSLIVLFLNVIFIIVAIMMTFKLITRVVMLLLLLAISPIGVVGFILPQTQKALSKEYWNSLLGQAFFLPVFFLFLLIAVKIINQTNILPDTENWTPPSGFNPLTNLTESVVMLAPTIIPILLIAGLLVAAVAAAQKVSSAGSGIVTKLSGQITATIGGAALGTAAFAGRNTVGRVADIARKSEAVQGFAERNRIAGALALRGLDGVAGSSFDARGSKAFSGVASATGVGDKAFGAAGGKDGIKGQDKKWQEQQVKTADLIEKKKLSDADKVKLQVDHSDKVQQEEAALKKAQEKVTNLQKSPWTASQVGAAKQAAQIQADAVAKLKKKDPVSEAENARKINYAKSIGADPQNKMVKFMNDWTIGTANKAASAQIMKSMSKEQQALNAITKAIQANTNNDSLIARKAKSSSSSSKPTQP